MEIIKEVVVDITNRDITKLLDSPEKFAGFITQYVNTGFKDALAGEEVASNLLDKHRTLQASVIRFCMGILLGFAEQEYTDGRNEMPVEMCKKIKQMVDDGELKMGWMV